MNAVTTFSVIIRLVKDTFRQAVSSGICWLLTGLSTSCILVCASVSVSGPQTAAAPGAGLGFLPRSDRGAQDAHNMQDADVSAVHGTLSLAFGAVRVAVARDVRATVHFFQLVLAAGVADTLGLLVTLVWTAGFLPGFLAPQSIAVLLAKPVPRWGLLAGKYLGVLAFVFAQAAYFVGGTWLALALRTGVWDAAYLLSAPLLLLQFAIFFGFSLLLAVCFRSTVVCVFGSIAFWGICSAINFGRHAVMAAPAPAMAGCGKFSTLLLRLADVAYWILPKPVDLGCLAFDALGAGTHFRPVLAHSDGLSLGLSVLTSLLFTVYILIAAERQFAKMDY
jgi:ABC-type transport system involved in multi-copper enzyme maturation permease subunit